jgi:hypothetical protein
VYGTTSNARALMLQARMHALSCLHGMPVATVLLRYNGLALHQALGMLSAQELRGLIQDNPALRGKMEFPPIPPSALASVFAQL